jgi:asparagine synthase (glutamine-hydrolysing)
MELSNVNHTRQGEHVSAIFGLYYRDGRFATQEEFERMQAALAHRGPDGAGLVLAGPAGLGHCVRWSTPESLGERQPVRSRDGVLLLTADARIDNRSELIAALDMRDRPPNQITDAELILAAYERWEEECPARLLGDFAFAVWNGRTRTLFCARDHMGVKPLYYYASDRLFAFATEIKALLCLPEVPRRLDERKVADHLLPLLEDPEITFYQGIVRLRAAHYLSMRPESFQSRRYWSLDPSRELRLSSDAAYAEDFRSVIAEAVGCRLRSAFPVGSALSGGLDSSSIACTARDLLRSAGRAPLHTFSAIFPGLPQSDLKAIDERRYIDAVVSMGGVEAHAIHGDELSPLADYDAMRWHTDGPLLAPNLYLHTAMYRTAEKQGVRVFLDGVDGDTTVWHGVDRLAELAWSGRWSGLIREARALARQPPRKYGAWQLIQTYGITAGLPLPLATTLSRVRGREPQATGWGIINAEFAGRCSLQDRLDALQAPNNQPVRNTRQGHWRGLTSAKLQYALELADATAGAFGVEPRYPFCDRRLVEFCLSLPADQKLRDGLTRAVLRNAMVGILPEEVRMRTTKGNLSPSFARRFLDRDVDVIQEALGRRRAVIEPYVDMSVLHGAYARYKTDPVHRVDDGLSVYRAVTLSLGLVQSSLVNSSFVREEQFVKGV